jgi:glycerol uptake facilitator-like aquaporin
MDWSRSHATVIALPTPMQEGLLRDMLAEFFGTFIPIVFGCGVVAQVVLSKGTAGSFLSINIAWGLAVRLAPAAQRKSPWGKVLPSSLAQLAGAFVASVVVFVTYHDGIYAFDGESQANIRLDTDDQRAPACSRRIRETPEKAPVTRSGRRWR